MKIKKFIFLLLIVVFSLTLFGCDITADNVHFSSNDSEQSETENGDGADTGNTDKGNTDSSNKGNGYSDNGYTESPDEGDDENSPVKLTWSAGSNTTVRIVEFGLHPRTETISFDFGYDTNELKAGGYKTLTFTLTFDARVDSGLNVSSYIDIYMQNNRNSQFGVGWSSVKFTNTNAMAYNYAKSIRIENLLQDHGKIYLTFYAVKNSFMTGTYFSNIALTVTAE